MPPNSSSLFVANARTALKMALLQIGSKNGGRVLIPDFICDVVLHPIHQAGLVPTYYPVNDDLEPDWTVLEQLAVQSGCRALIMVHYFGQPQDVERFRLFCSRHDLLLVEDNAHGYGGRLAGELLGSLGDIGISSPRKTLGTSSGGVLHRASALSFELSESMAPFPAYRPKQLMKTVLRSMPKARRWARGFADQGRNWSDPRKYRESVQPDYGIDEISRRRIVTADWPVLAEQRRKAWSAWAHFARAKGIRPVFPEVHPESCPWAMPAYARDLEERNSWLRWGSTRGVPLFPWPSLPEKIILSEPGPLARWQRMVCFPVDSTPGELGL